MPVGVIITLIISGSTVVLAPTLLRFATTLFGGEFRVSQDEQITCWILGGVMTMVAIIAALMPRRDSKPAEPSSRGANRD
ncbi:MAG: hypothetical protein AB7J34_16580 [Limisphaerales bacterium]